MEYTLMFPSKYLAAADLNGKDFTLVIESVEIAKLESADGTTKTKGIVTFEGAKKAWVLNRTCAEACKLMWGPMTEDWIGKRVTLYPQKMKDPFGDDEIIAIRVRGSPDLAEAKSATIQRGRKTIKVAVRPTGKGQPPKQNGKPPDKPRGRVVDIPAEMTDEEAESLLQQGEPGGNG